MPRSGNATRLGALFLSSVLFLACQPSGPNRDKPWMIVLERSPTAAHAQRQAEQYRSRGERFENTAGLSVHRSDLGLQHMVVLFGFSSEGEARWTAGDSRCWTKTRPWVQPAPKAQKTWSHWPACSLRPVKMC